MKKPMARVLVVVALVALAALLAIGFAAGQRVAKRMFRGLPAAGIGRPDARAVLAVDVRDGQGALVPSAEVILKKKSSRFWNATWAGVTNGRGTVTSANLFAFGHETTDGEYDVAVRARGYAPAFSEVTLPREGPLAMVVQSGRVMRVRVRSADGRALPRTLRPFVVLEGYDALWRSGPRRFVDGRPSAESTTSSDTLVLAEPEGDGRFRLNLPDQPDSFHLLVEEPGFLRAFWSGPYTTAPDSVLDLELPAPATLKVLVTADDEAIRATGASALSVDLVRREKDAEGRRSGSQIGAFWIEPAGAGAFTDWLAPGSYTLRGTTAGRSDQHRRDLARFTGGGEIELAAGDTAERALHFELVPPEAVQGDGRAVLTIVGQDGQPVRGREWRVTYSDREIRSYPVGHGTLPEDGRIVLEKLRDNGSSETYRVEVDGETAGTFHFAGADRVVETTLTRPPVAGDRAPALLLTRMVDGVEIDTASFTGQVVYLDFWATWCGPCQGPMGELHALALRHGKDWQGRVVLAAVSIDDDLSTLADHVAARRWTAPLHLWAGRGAGWKSEAARAFGISGVPTGVLVDRGGRIVWRGHPGDPDANLEKRIEDLLR